MGVIKPAPGDRCTGEAFFISIVSFISLVSFMHLDDVEGAATVVSFILWGLNGPAYLVDMIAAYCL